MNLNPDFDHIRAPVGMEPVAFTKAYKNNNNMDTGPTW